MTQDSGPRKATTFESERSAPPDSAPFETPCAYLPGRRARHEAYRADGMNGELYEQMMAHGFRRSGRVLYRPICRACRACQQLRVLVDRFTPTRAMRRVLRVNRDVEVIAGAPRCDPLRFDLFGRYLEHQHDGTMARTLESFRDFLIESPIQTLEFAYRVDGKLVAVSIADQCPGGLSSVYAFFDPDHRARSLGTFSALYEIDHCRRHGHPYYYLGFYVANSRTMAYKARFRPNEVLTESNRWAVFRE